MAMIKSQLGNDQKPKNNWMSVAKNEVMMCQKI